MKYLFVIFISIICILSFTNCDNNDGTSEPGSYTLSGTLTKSQPPDIENKKAYVKLVVSGGGADDDTLYFAVSEAFGPSGVSGHTADYSIPGIEEGQYTYIMGIY